MSRPARLRIAAMLVAALAAWLWTLDGGPPGALVALFDGDYSAGRPLGPHQALTLTFAPEVEPAAIDALTTDIDTRMRPLVRIVDRDARSLTLATDAGAASRAAVERMLSGTQGRFEILPVLEHDEPILSAWRDFLRGSSEYGVTMGMGTDVFEADSDDAYLRTVARVAAECARCRLGAELALVPERRSQRGSDRGDVWAGMLVSRAAPVFDQSMLADVAQSYDDFNHAVVMLTLTPEGDRRFAALSAAHVNDHLAFVINDTSYMAPVISGVIEHGPIMLQLGAKSRLDELDLARDLVAALRPGVTLPPGTTSSWSEHPGATASAIVLAQIMTALAAALLALVLAMLARALPFEPAPARTPIPSGFVPAALGPIAVTLVLAATPIVLASIPLPGVEDVGAPGSRTLGMLGIIPVFLAYLLVSLVVAIAPRLRRFRGGDLTARRALLPATALLALALSSLQGLGILAFVRSLDPFAFTLPPAVVLMLLVASCFALWLAAGLITRFGWGNGFAVLLASSVISMLPHLDPSPSGGELALMLLVSATLCFIVVHRVPSTVTPSRRLPLAGFVPLDLASTIFQWVTLLGGLLGWSFVLDGLDLGLRVAGLIALGVAFAWLYARPMRPALFLIAMLVSLAPLVATLLVAEHTARLGLSTFALIVALPVTLGDLVSELWTLLRAGPLVRIASTHDVDQADILLGTLASQGIVATVRAVRQRSLLRFMGPWLPVEVLVPRAQRQAAESALRLASNADLIAPFSDPPRTSDPTP